MVHCRGKVVPGRKAAAGTEPNSTVIRLAEASARAVQQENDVAALGLLGGSASLLSVPSWWSVECNHQ